MTDSDAGWQIMLAQTLATLTEARVLHGGLHLGVFSQLDLRLLQAIVLTDDQVEHLIAEWRRVHPAPAESEPT